MVGTCTKGTPRNATAAAKPARSPTTPPPSAITAARRSMPAASMRSSTSRSTAKSLDASPEGTAIVVATVSAIYGLGDPGSYLKMVVHIDRGDTIDQRE